MLRHVVMWKIAPEKVPSGSTSGQVAESLAASLRALVGEIPQILSLTAGENCVAAEGNWDLGLVVDVEDEDALRAYATHPQHLLVVEKIKALVAARAALDYDI